MKPGTMRATIVAMGTYVTIDVEDDPGTALDRAFGWFNKIKNRCSRFDPQSELAQPTPHVGEAVPVSPVLFEAVQFAIAVAADTAGAFAPAIGGTIEARGFD